MKSELDLESKTSETIPMANRPITKVPTLASDQEIFGLEEQQRNRKKFEARMTPRKARAIRRKLYLDLYKEASSKMLI